MDEGGSSFCPSRQWLGKEWVVVASRTTGQSAGVATRWWTTFLKPDLARRISLTHAQRLHLDPSTDSPLFPAVTSVEIGNMSFPRIDAARARSSIGMVLTSDTLTWLEDSPIHFLCFYLKAAAANSRGSGIAPVLTPAARGILRDEEEGRPCGRSIIWSAPRRCRCTASSSRMQKLYRGCFSVPARFARIGSHRGTQSFSCHSFSKP